MRALALCLGVGILLTASCGDDSKSSGTGTGTDTGTGTGTGTGPVTATGSCANLTCMNELFTLMSSCVPDGTCTTQTAMSGTSFSSNMCYSNGVKVSLSMAGTTAASSMTETVKKGSSVCYSYVMSGLTGASDVSVEIKNASGKTVGTITVNSTTNVETVTCADGSTGTIDASCGDDVNSTASSATASGSSTGSGCTAGTCAF
jgi:hypothetical protein